MHRQTAVVTFDIYNGKKSNTVNTNSVIQNLKCIDNNRNIHSSQIPLHISLFNE